MNNEAIKTIKDLKIGYIVHSFTYALLNIVHILVFYYIYWISKLYKNIFYIEIYIIIIFDIIPIAFYLCFTFLKLSKKYLNLIKVILKVCFYIFFVNGMFISINAWNNAQLLSDFFLNCPYIFNVNDIPQIFDNYQNENKKEIKKKCKYRRCFLIDFLKNSKNNLIIYNFICNINNNDKYARCTEFILDNQNINNELISYVKYCNKYTKLYLCQKIDDQIPYYRNYDVKCPTKLDFIFNYIISFLFIIVDAFFCSFPWLYEYFCVKDLISLLFREINNNHTGNNQSLRETNNTSKLDDNINSNENNQDNHSNFHKEPTRTIIIDNHLKNFNNINNYINEEKDLEILNINKNRISNIISKENNENNLSNKKFDDKNNNNNENSNSQNQMINNCNQNIFKVFNQKIN